MDFKYGIEEKLEALRELTKLGPIAQIRMKKAYLIAKKEAIKNKQANLTKTVEIDYNLVNNLELQLRMVELAKSLTPLWKKYVAVGEYSSGLSDYINDYLNQYIDKKIEEKATKTKKI